MKKSVPKNNFQAEPSSREYERSKSKIYELVRKYQIITAFILTFQCMYFASITEGWKGYLYNFVAIVILYFIVSGIFDRITRYIEASNKEISILRRQLTGFVCDTSLGRVSEANLKRIAVAVNDLPWRTNQNDLSRDDFELISRAWLFWRDQIGFEWQDDMESVNCGQELRVHSKDGTCSNLKWTPGYFVLILFWTGILDPLFKDKNSIPHTIPHIFYVYQSKMK